jgi:acyl-coenzyme A synthetase/AMP-(fatty) acid ligase
MFINKLERILTDHRHSKREFVISKYTYEDVYRLAADIRNSLKSINGPICLCTEDKGLIAAALLASLDSNLTMVLPYAFSDQAIREVYQFVRFKIAVTDQPEKLPPEIDAMVPDSNCTIDPSFPRITGPDSVFLKFYTGGSTGKPKMWSKTPRNLFEEAFYHSKRFNISKDDRILATVPPYHIYGFLFTVLIPFVSSAKVVAEICTFPQEIRNALQCHSATILVSVPIHYRILRDGEIPSDFLRIAFSSAGKLDKKDGNYFHKKTGVDLIEIYGSTETGGIATCYQAENESPMEPFDVVDWKVVDERLCVRSAFISPEISKDPEGFFMTGDRVRIKGNNTFILLGRVDSIVKVGGKRVDTEEIRNKFKQIQKVSEAIIITVPDARGKENEIWALVQGSIDKNLFREKASKIIEPYAIPRRIRIIDEIPISSSGKYDRKMLKRMFFPDM